MGELGLIGVWLGSLSLDVTRSVWASPVVGAVERYQDQVKDQTGWPIIPFFAWCPKILWLIGPSPYLETASQITPLGSDMSLFWGLVDSTSMAGPHLVFLGSPPGSDWFPQFSCPGSLHSKAFFSPVQFPSTPFSSYLLSSYFWLPLELWISAFGWHGFTQVYFTSKKSWPWENTDMTFGTNSGSYLSICWSRSSAPWVLRVDLCWNPVCPTG